MPQQDFQQELQQAVFQKAVFQNALWHSDIRYFQAGAQKLKILGGELSYMPDLSSQAGACVFHSLQRLPETSECWLKQVEHLFLERQVKRSRIYLQENHAEDEVFLQTQGYRKVIEQGLAGIINAEHKGFRETENITLRPITESLWPLHHRLLSNSDAAPDGHRMQASDYAMLERKKVQAGYMQLFLYIDQEQALAVGSLDIHNNFARLKNLLVHPDCRDKGLGKKLVKSLLQIAHEQGAKSAGAYALVNNQRAKAMYKAFGLQEIYQQFEWVKML